MLLQLLLLLMEEDDTSNHCLKEWSHDVMPGLDWAMDGRGIVRANNRFSQGSFAAHKVPLQPYSHTAIPPYVHNVLTPTRPGFDSFQFLPIPVLV